LLQYLTCNGAEPNRGTGKEEQQRKRNGTEIERETMKNQTTSCYICKYKTEDNPRPPALTPPEATESRQAEKKQTHKQTK